MVTDSGAAETGFDAVFVGVIPFHKMKFLVKKSAHEDREKASAFRPGIDDAPLQISGQRGQGLYCERGSAL